MNRSCSRNIAPAGVAAVVVGFVRALVFCGLTADYYTAHLANIERPWSEEDSDF